MTDFVGNVIHIGDKVVYVAIKKYGFMEKASVVGFTNYNVRIDSGRTVSPRHLVVYEGAPVIRLEDIL